MKLTYTFKGQTRDVDISQLASVEHLKDVIRVRHGLNPHRQGLKFVASNPVNARKPLEVRLSDNSEKLGTYIQLFNAKAGPSEEPVLMVKDMGPQFSYRGVFVIEYLGPILLVLFYASRPSFVYTSSAKSRSEPYDPVAWAGICLWIAHFLKREYETFFVHRFSRPTMPLANLFKNSAYYWGFAVVVGYVLCHPDYQAPESSFPVYFGAALMVVSELVNFAVHVTLRNMRPAEGSTKRDPPSGPLFSLVSCPNYTAEVLGWVGFSIMTGIFMSWVFTVVGFLQMTQWALGKHRGYLKSDPSYRAKGRKAIVPFVI